MSDGLPRVAIVVTVLQSFHPAVARQAHDPKKLRFYEYPDIQARAGSSSRVWGLRNSSRDPTDLCQTVTCIAAL